jgi:hypothetical protein
VLDTHADATHASPSSDEDSSSSGQALPNNGQLFSFEESADARERVELPKVTKPKPAARRTADAKKEAMIRAAAAASASVASEDSEEVPAYVRNDTAADLTDDDEDSNADVQPGYKTEIDEDDSDEVPMLNVKPAPRSAYMDDDQDDVSKASFLEI